MGGNGALQEIKTHHRGSLSMEVSAIFTSHEALVIEELVNRVMCLDQNLCRLATLD